MAREFVGRERELRCLLDAWQATRGAAQVVGVEGEPGIGKTALIRRFLDLAAPAAVVYASGDEDEAGLPWGVLAQISRALPGSRTGAASGGWDAQVDPAYAGQALAADLGEAKEVVLVVDDAHWGDRLSMAALRLAVRRLLAEPVLVILGYQSPELDHRWRRIFDSDRGRLLRLSGLPATDLPRLALACGQPGLSPAGAARLYEHTGGHPLHVRHLLDEVPVRAIVFGHGALPAPRGFAAAVGRRLYACQPGTRDLVGAAAVLGRRFRLATVRELAGVAAVVEAVAEAVDARLLEEVPGTSGQDLAFTSTLVRSVVYHDLDRARRRELHQRVAHGPGGTGALWHRIAAADGPDSRLAEDIEREARGYLARGQIPLAAAYLRYCLDVTPPGPDRTPRVLAAVEALLVTGDVAASLEYRDEVAAGTGAWSDYVAGYQLLVTGEVARAKARLEQALSAPAAGAPAPPDLRARIATQLAIIGVIAVSYPDMTRHAATAVAQARERWVTGFAWFARAIGLAVSGRADTALAQLSAAHAPDAPAGLDGLVARGMIRLWTDDLTGARQDLTTAVHRAARGETLRIGQALGFLGEVEYRRGALAEAVAHTRLAVGDAEENDRVWDYPMLHALAAYPLAAQGEWARAEWHAGQAAQWARQVATPAGLGYAAAARATLAQARADAPGLLAAATELEAIDPGGEPGTHLLGPARAEALCELGRVDEAAAAVDAFAARTASVGRRCADMGVARVRARIAAARGEHGEALRECQRAARLAQEVGMPLETGRIDLVASVCHGTAGRRAAAERALHAALDQFTALGAEAYAEQARRAAHRVGLSLDAPPSTLERLTPAERAVATLVCRGLSNREIAGQLVLSPKTVEYHLTNAFRRLDVSSRGELRQVVSGSL